MIWNSLPLDIRNSCSIASFRRQLKTFPFFNLWPSLVPRLTPAPQIRRVSRRQYCVLYKFIYLLTYLLVSQPTQLNWSRHYLGSTVSAVSRLPNWSIHPSIDCILHCRRVSSPVYRRGRGVVVRGVVLQKNWGMPGTRWNIRRQNLA